MTGSTDTFEALRAELVAAGHDADEVEPADRPGRSRIDGTYVWRRDGDAVVVAVDERGQEHSAEAFPSEAEAVRFLRRRLLERPPVRERSPEEAAAARERMQAKARATLDRLDREQGRA